MERKKDFQLEQPPMRDPIAVDESGEKTFQLYSRWWPWLSKLVTAVNSDDINNLPVHADNAAAVAGGLVRGQRYMTAAGARMTCLG